MKLGTHQKILKDIFDDTKLFYNSKHSHNNNGICYTSSFHCLTNLTPHWSDRSKSYL